MCIMTRDYYNENIPAFPSIVNLISEYYSDCSMEMALLVPIRLQPAAI